MAYGLWMDLPLPAYQQFQKCSLQPAAVCSCHRTLPRLAVSHRRSGLTCSDTCRAATDGLVLQHRPRQKLPSGPEHMHK